VRQFLLYVSQAAFENRTHLEQVEIAQHVLGKTGDFNPIDDASVRRVATLTRQKLQRYYTGDGRGDPVIVSLPVRSYAPVFRFREHGEAVPAAAGKRSWWTRAAPIPGIAAAAAVAILAALAIYSMWPAPETGVWALTTARGTIENKALDLPGSCLRLGRRVAANEDVSVRLRFTPEQVYQQAGLMIYQGPDQYAWRTSSSTRFRSGPWAASSTAFRWRAISAPSSTTAPGA
jgi:hypothetical protein